MIWFTSDQHFGHANIIRLCGRPFATPQEMDVALIQNWNAIIQPDDIVYVLGDFTYKSPKPLGYYAKALNGHKHLILGNHDKYTQEQYKEFFETVQDVAYITHEKQDIVLFHYPIISWKKRGKGAWHLYGHVHNAVISALQNMKAYNVGVDTNEFKPISFEQLKVIMESKDVKTSDREE